MHEGATSSGCISASLTVYELIRALHRVYVVYERVHRRLCMCVCVCVLHICVRERVPRATHAYACVCNRVNVRLTGQSD